MKLEDFTDKEKKKLMMDFLLQTLVTRRLGIKF